ncbi:MAG: DsbA family protein, partial [Selenomonadaceae bacterium]|nr:DsbA family protein [Selenomonadaceae bacterium]
KAAQLVDANKADEFLYRLRFATIVDCRPTTRTSEILKVVIKSGLDHKKFLTAYNDGSAEKNFQNDLQLCRRIGIHELPSYMLQYQSKGALIRGLASFDDFANVIDDLSGIKPESPVKSLGTLRELIAKHRLISPIEIREAFDFKSVDEVQKFIAPLVDSHEIKIVDVPHGWFIETEALA